MRCGVADGNDRVVMLLESLWRSCRSQYQQVEDLLMGAPSEVTQKQLRELHIRLSLPERK
jgi:aspartyl-tRNA synthetase